MARPLDSPDPLRSVVRASAPDRPDELLKRVLADMGAAWARGERPVAEDYLARHAELRDQPEAAADLVYEEVCLREQYGEAVSTEAVLRRFPQWRDELEVLLDCRELFEEPAPQRLVAAGQRLGEFRLVSELGRGGGGVVFLATQPALADRPVVLKLTRSAGCEHLRLARLQHTHIVPLYSVQDDAGRGLRALCMPYFGGTSLSRLLASLGHLPAAKRTGKDLLAALDRAQAASPIAVSARGSARQLLARATYVQAVCWVGGCLANALHYAHERGLVHLDLKPSNVLLTADAQPMLLDFHLAREPLAPGAAPADGFGGTDEYMSPEQKDALAAVCAGRPVAAAVDARSDVYSLGVLLYEALGGSLPATAGAARRLRRTNPGVSAGLADVLSRCLALDPRYRYADAGSLAEDLQRHLRNLPLRGVPNRSLVESWRKWRRRRPHVFPLALTLLTVILAGLLIARAQLRSRIDQARNALADGKARLEERRYAEAAHAAEHGLRLAESVPFHDDLEQALRDLLLHAEQVRAAEERDRLASELHLLTDRVRRLDGAALTPEARRGLERSCRSLWERRATVLARLGGPDSGRGASVRQDLLDLALFWTDLEISLAASPAEKDVARKDALRVLAEAEQMVGPNAALLRRREVLAAAAGLDDVAREAARRRAALPAGAPESR